MQMVYIRCYFKSDIFWIEVGIDESDVYYYFFRSWKNSFVGEV